MKTISRPRRSGSGARPLSRLVPYAILFTYCATGVFGLGWIISSSLKTNIEFLLASPWTLPADPQWSNYSSAWTTANIGSFFANSTVASVVGTTLGVLVAVLAVYPIARIPYRLNTATLTLFLSGLVVPWVVTFVPLFFLLQRLNLIDNLFGLGLLYATYNIPFNLYVLSGYVRTIPGDLEDAAGVDGATPWQVFRLIFLPLARPGIITVAILSLLHNWNEFLFALVFLTSSAQVTIPVGLARLAVEAEYATNWVVLFAGVAISALPVLLAYAVLQRRVEAGLAEGALRG